jgi:hypothetical protein
MATKREVAVRYEGHGESSKAPEVQKGTFLQVGTVVEGPMVKTFPKGISPNVKSGTGSGGEQ